MLKLPMNGALCRATRTSLLAALFLLGQVLLLPATADDPQEGPRLPPFTASYEAQAMGNTLNARITLNHEDVQTRMAMDAHVSGFLRILGRFELSREALMNANDVGLQLVTSRSREVTPGASARSKHASTGKKTAQSGTWTTSASNSKYPRIPSTFSARCIS